MKIKTVELSGKALDWAVATTMNEHVVVRLSEHDCVHLEEGNMPLVVMPSSDEEWYMPFEPDGWSPSTLWQQGGPLIEQHGVDLSREEGVWSSVVWKDDESCDYLGLGQGEKPLVAAMRAIVAATIGSEVDVPDELVGGEA